MRRSRRTWPAPAPGRARRTARRRPRRDRGPDQPAARAETCDVADPDSVADLADRLADEEVSIVVNNAGIAGPVAPLVEVSPQEWDEVFAVNVRGTYLVCRAFLPPMLERGDGDVVNVASVSGKRPLARRTPYCASKTAVLGLTSTLAFEAGPAGVRVNALSPGPVEGDRMERNFALGRGGPAPTSPRRARRSSGGPRSAA